MNNDNESEFTHHVAKKKDKIRELHHIFKTSRIIFTHTHTHLIFFTEDGEKRHMDGSIRRQEASGGSHTRRRMLPLRVDAAGCDPVQHALD